MLMLSQNIATLADTVILQRHAYHTRSDVKGLAGQLWAPTLVRAASFYAPFSAGSGDVRYHTPLGVASPARPVATQPLVFWRFGGIARGHFPYPPYQCTGRHAFRKATVAWWLCRLRSLCFLSGFLFLFDGINSVCIERVGTRTAVGGKISSALAGMSITIDPAIAGWHEESADSASAAPS